MNKKLFLVFTLLIVSLLSTSSVAFATRGGSGGRGDGPVIYVTSQGKFYDSIVTADPLPMEGDFQKLEMEGPSGLQTKYGIGDTEYLGGRWWVDVNGDDIQNEGDHFFSCPLLGPGRDMP